ncbi:hypothetical protein CQA38_05150 [Campylobacter sp. MIT 12-5580]|uniref:hypothetical protein n=1 Tax=Campylobacter sp. MIT 12-5580 TaxID=2040651 RepID=UPI0010F81022|nr:hypothetical protein [Campylobacter sp. MIT 12-5580]TKX28953.1 hypothetical protein CQA38_05150 [Campylobacter sp. MIT 12-5580]
MKKCICVLLLLCGVSWAVDDAIENMYDAVSEDAVSPACYNSEGHYSRACDDTNHCLAGPRGDKDTREACFSVASPFLPGGGYASFASKKDYGKKELYLLSVACNKGDWHSCGWLAERFRTGDGVKKNMLKYRAYELEACDLAFKQYIDENNDESIPYLSCLLVAQGMYHGKKWLEKESKKS